ncbi:uncharacterized protein LOC132698359 [Cylas formicarius]|uniref:uncharacterized protein LOC132698359 n=1 Tax=Cylas formicarius TaxID=197179 RepID=UPI002958C7B8|nr:uncharacterized protein LOC132698359 [Cylas formicarius]
MEELERRVQKLVQNFCTGLPGHVEKWKIIFKDVQDPIRALVNFSEQLICVEKARIEYMDNFDEIQRILQYKILSDIEDELLSISTHIDQLTNLNQELKNKLSTLERTTVDLDWESETALIRGTPSQPPLDRLLEMGYDFWIYFSTVSKNINAALKNLNVRDAKRVDTLRKCFCLDLENPDIDTDRIINYFLAVTQYVGS